MLGERVPGFGAALGRWRRRSRRSVSRFAECLSRHGFDRWGDPVRLAESLRMIEADDEWPFGQDAVKPFIEACVACLDDHPAYGRYVARCLAVLAMRRANMPESMLGPSLPLPDGSDGEDDEEDDA